MRLRRPTIVRDGADLDRATNALGVHARGRRLAEAKSSSAACAAPSPPSRRPPCERTSVRASMLRLESPTRCLTRRVRAGTVVAGLCLAAAACGGSESSPAPPARTSAATPPDVISVCAGARGGWQTLDGVTTSAATLGTGPAVVFANDSGNNACGWIALAQRIAADGHRVVVFEYSDTSAAAEGRAVRETLQVAAAAREGQPFALVGASLGGRVAIEAAARRPSGLAAIVSLSGERTIDDYRDILPDARRVRAPALYIGAREDTLTDGGRQQRELHEAMRGRPNELLQRPGAAHGVELIDSAVPADRLVAFVTRQLG